MNIMTVSSIPLPYLPIETWNRILEMRTLSFKDVIYSSSVNRRLYHIANDILPLIKYEIDFKELRNENDLKRLENFFTFLKIHRVRDLKLDCLTETSYHLLRIGVSIGKIGQLHLENLNLETSFNRVLIENCPELKYLEHCSITDQFDEMNFNQILIYLNQYCPKLHSYDMGGGCYPREWISTFLKQISTNLIEVKIGYENDYVNIIKISCRISSDLCPNLKNLQLLGESLGCPGFTITEDVLEELTKNKNLVLDFSECLNLDDESQFYADCSSMFWCNNLLFGIISDLLIKNKFRLNMSALSEYFE